jgi:hypothetical protein
MTQLIIPALTFQFSNFYDTNISGFLKRVSRHLNNSINVTFSEKNQLIPNDSQPIILGDIIPTKVLSNKSNHFIYFVFDFENVDQIIQHLNYDLSTIKNPEEDVVVKFVCDFQIKN